MRVADGGRFVLPEGLAGRSCSGVHPAMPAAWQGHSTTAGARAGRDLCLFTAAHPNPRTGLCPGRGMAPETGASSARGRRTWELTWTKDSYSVKDLGALRQRGGRCHHNVITGAHTGKWGSGRRETEDRRGAGRDSSGLWKPGETGKGLSPGALASCVRERLVPPPCHLRL